MNAFTFLLFHSILFFCIGFPSGLATSLGNETDRLALLSFKDLISHDPLQVMSSWNDSHHFCEWTGVTCSRRHQRVIMLNLQSQELVGSLSSYIGNLSFLRKINLENNSFQGEIPNGIDRLFRLQELNMSNNSLVGEIPTNLSHCSNLKILGLGYNKLVGNIPIEIGSLSKLVSLYLPVNNLTGGIPASIGNLSSLGILSIGENRLEGSIPNSLGQLKNLNILALRLNNLSGMIPSSLYNLTYLEIFSVTGNQLIGKLPIDIGLNLPNLRWILIAINQFSGSIPISLFNASRLERLSFRENNLVGKVPIEVGNLKGLQHLNLGFNNLGTRKDGDLDFLDSLTNTTDLDVLDINTNHFGGKLPNSIANLSNKLNKLFLGTNEIFGNISSEIGNLVNLIVLTMDHNFLTGSIPKGIGMLQNLQVLDLSGNSFSGKIPSSIGNLSQLYALHLSDNLLEGNIISNLGKSQYLKILELSNNNLNGIIPEQVIGLSAQFRIINLANNFLIGSLPSEVGNLKSLEYLGVSENKLFGKFPSTLGSCLGLEYLYLQGNFFQGPIPTSFSLLKGIRDLDLSRNNLSEKIPKDLEGLSFLQNLNLSFNNLEGEVPTEGIFQNASEFSIVGNNQLCGGIHKLQLPPCPIHEYHKHGMSLALKVIISVILPIIVVTSLITLFWRRKTRRGPSSTFFLGRNWYKRVSYGQLHKATGGFDSNNLIGVGNFGSVYKGVLHQDEIPIAVKVLKLMERGASKSFMAECNALRKVRHRNLIKILTVCSSVDFKGNDFKALVFHFMTNGSLESWLHPSSNEQHPPRNLNLHQRLNIAIDVASALDYLHNHCETPIVHCDLKPSNVFLDETMTAIVGDFGLAKFLSKSSNNSRNMDTNSSIAIKGTIGYIPPEYGLGVNTSTQGDVYSYGIFLLEMFTGRRPTNDLFKDGLNLHHLCKRALTEGIMEIVDPLLLLEDHEEAIIQSQNEGCDKMNKVQDCLISIIRIGVTCSAESPGERMDINDVLMELAVIMKMFSDFT